LRPSLHKSELTFKTAFCIIVIYCAVVLAFTVAALDWGPPDARIGTTRPTDTIPSHIAELAGGGLLLGIGLLIIYGRKGLPLVALAPILTIALDMDHLPAYLGIAQTIRPAHSLLFIPVVLVITAITIKRLDIDLVVLSATLAHMGIDTGIFAPYSPVSFAYFQLDPYRIPFLAGAVISAVAVGLVSRGVASQLPQRSGGGVSNA